MTQPYYCAPCRPSPVARPSEGASRPVLAPAEANFREQLRSLSNNAAGRIAMSSHISCVKADAQLAPSSLTGRPNAERPGKGRDYLESGTAPKTPLSDLDRVERERRDPDATLDKPAGADQVSYTELCTEPLVRVLSALMPSQPSCSPPVVPSGVMLDRIALQLVRKVGVGSSSVHLEFGAGVLADGKLTLHSTDEGLEIALQSPVGMDATELSAALVRRLERKGIKLARLEVT